MSRWDGTTRDNKELAESYDQRSKKYDALFPRSNDYGGLLERQM